MADQHSGDHLLNHGPIPSARGKGSAARERRRIKDSRKYEGWADMGRDELFKQRLGLVPKGRRIFLPTETAESDRQPEAGTEGEDQ